MAAGGGTRKIVIASAAVAASVPTLVYAHRAVIDVIRKQTRVNQNKFDIRSRAAEHAQARARPCIRTNVPGDYPKRDVVSAADVAVLYKQTHQSAPPAVN